MKKIFLTVICALTAFLMSACAPSQQTDGSDKPQVYASFYAVYDFARQIAGDKADVHLLCPVGSEPHDYEPKTSEAAAVSKADLFIYNGGGVDSWAEQIASGLSPSSVVCVSENISHDSDDDTHVWLDPVYALREAENIKIALTKIDPENAPAYDENLKIFSDNISQLINDYTSSLSELEKRDIVVAHAAYSYLCSKFGLNQIAIEDSQGTEPSPARMAEIVNTIKEKNIQYICAEELESSKVVDTIAKETGAQTVSLNPFEGDKENRDYFEVMENNLEVLKQILR